PTAKPNKELKSTHKERPDHVRPYATEALNFYDTESGLKYELVEPGHISTVVLSKYFLHHIDFTAKDTDVAGAPVEMFFAELTTTNNVRCVKFCTSM
ncbi:hypothetical protein MKW94_012039, partial [Papaver nudicaule]|nr:hypothetical protein [Papaver nudicaule]